jgi:hypothetical protein
MSLKQELRRDYRGHAERLIELDKLLPLTTDEKKKKEYQKERESHAHQLVHLADLMETCD